MTTGSLGKVFSKFGEKNVALLLGASGKQEAGVDTKMLGGIPVLKEPRKNLPPG